MVGYCSFWWLVYWDSQQWIVIVPTKLGVILLPTQTLHYEGEILQNYHRLASSLTPEKNGSYLMIPTVDGIHFHPVDMVSISLFLQGFIHSRLVSRISSINCSKQEITISQCYFACLSLPTFSFHALAPPPAAIFSAMMIYPFETG